MTEPSFRNTGGLIACCIGLQWASSAAAAESGCDLACPRGYVCELVEGCLERFDGEPCALSPICRPLPCSSDSECEQHMKCYQETGPDTPGICLPGWQLSCGSDADCGGGFTCAPWEPCLGPSERADAGGACQPEGELVCYIHTQACQADADCLAGWTCENNPHNAYISGPNGDECAIGEPALLCVPPHGQKFGLGAGYLDWQTGVEWSSRRVPVSECPEPRLRSSDYTLSGGIDEPAAADLANDPVGRAAAGPVSSTSAREAASPMASSASDGCSLGSSGVHHPATAPWSLLSLAALTHVVWRARRRRS